jgi:hypothetical protein
VDGVCAVGDVAEGAGVCALGVPVDGAVARGVVAAGGVWALGAGAEAGGGAVCAFGATDGACCVCAFGAVVVAGPLCAFWELGFVVPVCAVAVQVANRMAAVLERMCLRIAAYSMFHRLLHPRSDLNTLPSPTFRCRDDRAPRATARDVSRSSDWFLREF